MSHITLDKKKLSVLAAAATAVLLAACGGGGGSGPLASAGALTGVVVDGYCPSITIVGWRLSA